MPLSPANARFTCPPPLRTAVAGLLAMGALALVAADEQAAKPTLAGPAPASVHGSGSQTNVPAPIEQVAPGVLRIGQAQLDQHARTVTFPASLNMREGMVEYLLVHEGGKTHESVLKTDTQPYHIHLALLLLGAKGASPDSLSFDPSVPLKGESVHLRIQWIEDGNPREQPGERLVRNRVILDPLSEGPWTFNGSRVIDGTFIAQRDGSLVSVIFDVDSLINNPRPGREDDELWEVNPESIPPMNVPVQVIVELKQSQPAIGP
ncbi:MAG TPA: YdjY domain-containing protein [Methylomirabilota bacterium]|nr:YdjY domain-containing protein [Methylomirabilota bacterium]